MRIARMVVGLNRTTRVQSPCCCVFDFLPQKPRSACLAERIIACPSRPVLYIRSCCCYINRTHTHRGWLTKRLSVWPGRKIRIVEFFQQLSCLLEGFFSGCNCLSCRAERLKTCDRLCEMSPLRNRRHTSALFIID